MSLRLIDASCSWKPLYSKLRSEFEFFVLGLATFRVFSALRIRLSAIRLHSTLALPSMARIMREIEIIEDEGKIESSP